MYYYYSPIFDFYEKHKRDIHDFLFHLGVYLTLAFFDLFINHFFQVNYKPLILILTTLIYTLAFFIIRRYKLRSQFGSIFSRSLSYTLFIALTTYWFYLIFVRVRFQK